MYLGPLNRNWKKPPLLREVEEPKLRPVYAGIVGTLWCLMFILTAASTAVVAAHLFVVSVEPDVPAEAPYLDMTVTERAGVEFSTIGYSGYNDGTAEYRTVAVYDGPPFVERMTFPAADTITINGRLVVNGQDVTSALEKIAREP